MVANITVKFSAKIQAAQFTPVEHGDELSISVEYENEEELTKKIEYWQDYIQARTIKATFNGANKLLEMKKEIES